MATTIKQDVGLDVFTSGLFLVYGVTVLTIGGWGYAIIPQKCTDDNIRNNMRTVIVSGAVMIAAFLSYGLCAVTCRGEASSKDKGTYLKKGHNTPNWLLIFTLIMTCVSLISILKAIGNMDSDEIKNICQGKGFDIWKTVTQWIIVFQVIILLFIVFTLGYRLWSSGEKSRKSRKKELDNALKDLKDIK